MLAFKIILIIFSKILIANTMAQKQKLSDKQILQAKFSLDRFEDELLQQKLPDSIGIGGLQSNLRGDLEARRMSAAIGQVV